MSSQLLTRALAIAQAAIDYAYKQDIRIAVVILDQSFEVLVAMRMDGAYPHTVKVAAAKAHAALNFRTATDEMRERVSDSNAAAIRTVEPRLMFVGGGVPLDLGDGRVISVGVSGASEEQDTATAHASIASLA